MVRETANKTFEYHEYGDNDHLRTDAQESRVKELDRLLGRYEVEEHTLSDTENSAISGGEAVHAKITVINEDDDHIGSFFLRGDSNAVVAGDETGSHFGTSKGTDAQTNVYWDSDQYEVENQTGGEVTYEIIIERSV